MSEAFHPEKSKVSEEKMADFLRAPITGDLLEVPGIGPASVKALAEKDVNTTYQLIAKYLELKDADVGPIEHTDRFYYWLKAAGTAAGQRAGVVLCIAEKMNITFNGLYDGELYEE